jgi:hypothetical protein
MFETPGHGLDDGIETREQGSRRQQIGQQINASPTQFGIHQRLARRDWRHGGKLVGNDCYSNGSGKFGNKPGYRYFRTQCGGKNKKGRSSAAPFAKCQVDQFLV